jgi:integrase
VTGNPRQISRTFEGSERDADKALRRFLAEVEAQEVTVKPVLLPEHSLNDLFDRFIRLRTLEASTIKGYRGYFEKHISPAFGHAHVSEPTTAVLNEFYRNLRQMEGLSPTTIRQIHALISSIYRFGIAESFGGLRRGDNPANGAEVPKLEREPIIAPSVEQVQRLLDPAVHLDPRFLLACRLAVYTGARRGEICGLRWADLSENRRLHITRAVWDPGEGKELVVKMTKSRGNRTVGLDEETWNMLCEVRLDPTLKPRDFILSGGPTPMSPRAISYEWGNLCARIGETGVRFHDLRHFHATQLLRNPKTSIADVSRRLGHANASTTLNIYAHAMPEDDANCVEAITESMGLAPMESSEPVRFQPRGT